MGAYLDAINRRGQSRKQHLNLPDTVICRRCGGMSLAVNVDDCLGCSSVELCPECMLAHDCAFRALLAEGLRSTAP